DVGATVDLVTDQPLRRHVVGCNRTARAGTRVEGSHRAEPEPSQKGPAIFGEEDVRRLDVAVHGGARVRVVERGRVRTQEVDDADRLVALAVAQHAVDGGPWH